MTTALWTVLAFAAWTLIVLMLGVGTRRWYLILTGQAQITNFPADRPHGCVAYQRAMRAHANCVENLPVYAAIVLTAAMAQRVPPDMDTLAMTFMLCRIAQSSVHMVLPETNATVATRFTFFIAQIGVMFWMMLSIASLGISESA